MSIQRNLFPGGGAWDLTQLAQTPPIQRYEQIGASPKLGKILAAYYRTNFKQYQS